jgi:pimeloyl-ACP methyl ester carboxylesterase
MSTFVLIHGAFHGAWCSNKVTPSWSRQGVHKVVALDLPGHGGDQAPAAEVTLEAYADRVVEALDAHPEPVVLVGHSLSGTVISQVAERRPEKINKLEYLCVQLLPSGNRVGRTSPASTQGSSAT